jgi:hypothetical protein
VKPALWNAAESNLNLNVRLQFVLMFLTQLAAPTRFGGRKQSYV